MANKIAKILKYGEYTSQNSEIDLVGVICRLGRREEENINRSIGGPNRRNMRREGGANVKGS